MRGPSVEKGISFSSPLKYVNVSFSLGKVSNSDEKGFIGNRYCINGGFDIKHHFLQ